VLAVIGPRNPLAAAGLDRLGLIRKDPGRVLDRLAGPDAVVVPVRGGQVAVAGSPPVAVVVDALSVDDAWLLGQSDDGRCFFAVDLDGDGAPDLAVPSDATWSGLREVAAALPALDAHLLATATGLATWHRTHRFCGACGAATVADWAGHRRRCEGCGREHFPRTDPAIIVAVTHRDRVLLARNPQWPPGFASVLAGFVEPGESLEDAVAREVLEEAGVTVRDVTYRSSQPWPFPSSVMVGFTAEAESDELQVDPEELADAAWYTRDEVREGAVGIPPPVSIARRLLDDWLDGA
jgi:NAD+ diphosphatase